MEQEEKPLFDHEEYKTKMEYYYSVFLDSKSVLEAAYTLKIDINTMWEAIYYVKGMQHE